MYTSRLVNELLKHLLDGLLHNLLHTNTHINGLINELLQKPLGNLLHINRFVNRESQCKTKPVEYDKNLLNYLVHCLLISYFAYQSNARAPFMIYLLIAY